MTDELKVKRDAKEQTEQVQTQQLTPEQAALQLVTQLAAAKFNDAVMLLNEAISRK